MRYSSLQIRFLEQEIKSGAEINIVGKRYMIGHSIPQTLAHENLPIGVVMTGYTRQHELLLDGKSAGEAWFYFYGAVEGKRWAVLDELELFTEESRAA